MSKSADRGVSLLLLSALLLSLAAVPLAYAVAPSSSTSSTSTTTSTSSAAAAGGKPVSLTLSVVPPKLPADGGSYPSVVVSLVDSNGAASLALNDTVVFLTSSQQGVGNISPVATIQKGSGFAVANFTTNTTPGTTTISASSSGLSAASSTLTTATPSGFATRLTVIPVPAAQLANPTGQGTVLVETLDSSGLPAKASSNIAISLTSSNNNVVSLPSGTLVLAGGSVISSATYNVGISPGTATITGSASGFAFGSGTVTVQGASPYALAIFAQPNPIAASTTGRLVVTLVDQRGDPAPAPTPVKVALSSSNTSIIASDLSATIPTGGVYAVASFASQGSPGTANLTASSPGLMSGFAAVIVSQPVAPAVLAVIAAPNPVPADSGTFSSVVVALTDASGRPAVAASSVTVTLASSNSAVGNVTESLNIPSGLSYAVATFTSTYFVGSTIITASAQNLQSATTTVRSYGPVPAKIVVQATASKLPADGSQYPALAVMLEDASGLPAVAPADIAVQLTSSSTDIANVDPTAVIGAGHSYSLASVTTSISAGAANITATASGFSPSSTGFTTASPAPSQLGFYVAPSTGIQSLAKEGDAIVAVQLQDSTSSPAAARQDTPVVVTSSNAAVIAKPLQLDIPAGADYAWTYVKALQPGQSVLTASTNGLASASGKLSELSLPISITLTAALPVVSVGDSDPLQLLVQVMGTPISGANVTITTSSGLISVPVGVTDSAGQFADTFLAAENGLATVTAVVHDAALGYQMAQATILVAHSTGSGTSSKGLGLLALVLPIVVVVVVVAIIAVGARRVLRNRSKAPEEGEEEDAEPQFAGRPEK